MRSAWDTISESVGGPIPPKVEAVLEKFASQIWKFDWSKETESSGPAALRQLLGDLWRETEVAEGEAPSGRENESLEEAGGDPEDDQDHLDVRPPSLRQKHSQSELKPDPRLAKIAQRADATKGGTVQLKRASISDPGSVVKDLLAKSPQGLNRGEILKGLDAAFNPGHEFNLRRIMGTLDRFRWKGFELDKFLPRIALQDHEGRWQSRTVGEAAGGKNSSLIRFINGHPPAQVMADLGSSLRVRTAVTCADGRADEEIVEIPASLQAAKDWLGY